jgi:type II secretory ATPase GspE/PulE/Tfp pilus assembly ATPase PilB-like protein
LKIRLNITCPALSKLRPIQKAGYTFLEGLRSALRQDPDIIMVGEIRDSETAEIAINAALTGHLVFSTLHTNNAGGTFPRLIDLGSQSKSYYFGYFRVDGTAPGSPPLSAL